MASTNFPTGEYGPKGYSSEPPFLSTAWPPWPPSTKKPVVIFCDNDTVPIPVGTEVRRKCQRGEGFEILFCDGDGILKPLVTNRTFCLSPKVKDFQKELDDDRENSKDLASKLALITSTDNLTPGDIRKTTQYFQKLQRRIEEEEEGGVSSKEVVRESVESMITVGASIIAQKSWDRVPSSVRVDTANDILSSMEATAFVLAGSLSTFPHETEATSSIAKGNVHVDVAVSRNSEDDLILPKINDDERKTDSIVIPLKNFAKIAGEREEGVKVVFLTFAKISDFLSDPNLSTDDADALPTEEGVSVEADWTVNANVVTASVHSKGERTDLEFPVSITFKNREAIKKGVINRTVKCVFWDNYKSRGIWSEEGCVVTTINSTHTVCSCDHLTSFSVLMDFNAVFVDHSHKVSLAVITYVGCVLSILALLLAFATFTLFKNLQCERNTLHKNLCFSLMAAEIVFLSGIDRTRYKLVCSSIAALLHFFFLSAFAWMCLEGIQLYLMLVKVFEPKRSRAKWYYLFGYGVPAVIVATTIALSETLHETTRYGTEKYCWLSSEDGFVFAFVVPVMIVLSLNISFLVMAFYQMCTHAKSARSGNHEYSVWTWVKGAAVLVVLLGLTWSTGLLLINEESLVVAYVFTVLNSLQGLFIFVFHCCSNDKVRKEYSKVYHRYVRHLSKKPGDDNSQIGSSSGSSHFLKWWEKGILKRSKESKDAGGSNRMKDKSMEERKTSSGVGLRSSQRFLESGGRKPSSEKREEEDEDGEEEHELHILSTIDASVVDSDCVSEYFNGQIDETRRPEADAVEHVYQDIVDYIKPEPLYAVLEQPYPTGIYEVNDYLEPVSCSDIDGTSDESVSGVVTDPVSIRVKQNEKSPSKATPRTKGYSPHGAFLKDIPSRFFRQSHTPAIELKKYVRRSSSPPSVMTTSMSSSTMSTSLRSSVLEDPPTRDHDDVVITSSTPLPDVTRTYRV